MSISDRSSRKAADHRTRGKIGGKIWSIVLSAGLAANAATLAVPAHAETGSTPARIAAATPPMGWNPFNVFRLDYDESDVMAAAEALVRLGLADDGYRYVNIDDGWWLQRTAKGIRIRTNLYPSARLADGTTSLRPFVDRLHAMGLKAGIYTDIGYNSCSQRWEKTTPNLPVGTRAEREVGALGHEVHDARAFFTEWGFDLVKVDACGIADFGAQAPEVRDGTYRMLEPLIVRGKPGLSDTTAVERLYAHFAEAVRQAPTGRAPIISICAWGEATSTIGRPLMGRCGVPARTSLPHGHQCSTISTAPPRDRCSLVPAGGTTRTCWK